MGKWAKRGIALIFVVDFLAALVLYQQAIIARETIAKPPRPASVETFGKLAVQTEWKGYNDVDLYVMSPSGEIVYFSSPNVTSMHLEHDDLGVGTSSDFGGKEQERVIIRSTEPGEYVANVHMYGALDDGKSTPVTVTLYQLQGDDKPMKEVKVVLGPVGDEQTAFRFTVDKTGRVTATNRLPRTIVCMANELESGCVP